MSSKPPCPEVAHAAITASAVSFAAGTVFQSASGDDRVVTGWSSGTAAIAEPG